MKTRYALAVVLFVVAVAPLAAAQPATQLAWQQTCDGEVRVRGASVQCWTDAIPEPTPEPTTTPEPTPEPTATPEPGGVPLCQHDTLSWHDLYDETQNCRHDHEHGDDPAVVDDVFGVSGEFFGHPGMEIGSPAVPPHELAEGHRFWKVWTGANLTPANNEVVGSRDEYIRAFRVQTHAASGGNGIKHRYHGFVAEIQACRPTGATEQCGMYQATGTFDYGNLHLLDASGNVAPFLLPHEGDGQDVPLLLGRRIHSAHPNSTGATWYPRTWASSAGNVDVQVIVQDGWAWVEPGIDDVTVHNTDAGNGSARQLHAVAVTVFGWMPHNGEIPVDTYGNPDATCRPWRLGCGVLMLDHWPANDHLRYAERVRTREYDTSPAGEAWITYPN